MPRISGRIAAIQESATLAVDARAKALVAAGEAVIGFGAGEPDFPTPTHIVEAAARACADPRFHKYTPTPGLPELREAIAVKTARDSAYQVEPAQVLVTNGGKQAIFNTFATLLDPGDEVLVPAPYWVTYPEAIRLAGGVPVAVETDESTGFRATLDRLDAARTPRTKALLFVSPSNPTGAVYRRDEVEAIGRWAVEHGLWVVTDEIYEHLVYDGHHFHSMPTLVPELAERCVVVNGVAKTYAMTGWRVGWMIAPLDVTKAATNLQSHSTSNVANVSQAAALAAVSGDLEAAAMMRGVRPPAAEDPRAAERRPRRVVHRARGRVLRVPLVQGRARSRDPRPASHVDRRAGRDHPRRGPGGDRAGRGVRRLPAVRRATRPRRRDEAARGASCAPTCWPRAAAAGFQRSSTVRLGRTTVPPSAWRRRSTHLVVEPTKSSATSQAPARNRSPSTARSRT